MSERFGVPDHAPQHAPSHAPQNPTPQGTWSNIGGGSGWAPPAPIHTGGALPASTSPPATSSSPAEDGGRSDRRKSIVTAAILAILFGPLGIFYVGCFNGIVALFIAIPLASSLAYAVLPVADGAVPRAVIALVSIWCVTVPWAIVGAIWRNRRTGIR